MRIFILARTQHEITQQIYPALADTQARIVGYATSTGDLGEQLGLSQPDFVLVNMTLSRRGKEQTLLESLAPNRLIVVLPRGRSALKESLQVIPHVAAVEVEPVDYSALLQAAAKEQPASVDQAQVEPTPAAPRADVTAQPASPPRPSWPQKTRVIAFTSGLMGGTGKSTLAGTLAYMLTQETKLRVILLAFDTPPAAATHFKLARWPHVGLFLAGEEPFEQALQRQGTLTVGIAPGDPLAYDKIGALMPGKSGAVLRAIEEATARFDLVIADLPPNSSGWAVHPLLAADDVAIVARPAVADQAGVVQAVTLLKGLRQSHQAMPIHLVINDRGEQDIDAKAFIAGVEQMIACPPLAATIPSNEAVRLAQNEGVPLPLAEGTADVVGGLRRLAAHLGYEMQAEEEEETAQAQSGSSKVRPGRKRKPAFTLPGIQFKFTD